MYQIIFYVPSSHCEMVKSALFEAGAGRIGDYDQCAWQVAGTGQFRPLDNSDAFIGKVYQLEKLAEFRVEMVCDHGVIKKVINALLSNHPYQTPAYHILEVKTLADFE